MAQLELLEEVNAIFSAYMEKNGHRKTPERFAILKEIYTSGKHFDIEELYQSMKEQNYRVSRATLYNTIELLLACNLVRKHRFDGNISQFEAAHGNKQHDHMICTDTGEVIEFCDPRIHQIKATVEKLFGVKILHHSLYFYGVKDADSMQDQENLVENTTEES